jgi:uncharacterized caspase-like protein
MPFLYRIATLLAVLAPLFAAPINARELERRFALVIGNSEYAAGRQPTAANDAGLIAETLRAAGFDIAGARDLDQNTLRRSIREFLDKVSAAGPQAMSLIYLAGYGLQFEGENYIVPIDASIHRDDDIPIEAIRISDFTRPLAGTPGAVKLFIVDAARQHPFTPEGPPLASGLALVEPDPGTLIAFNAAPGSIASIESGPYGAFAQALAEMIGTGGLGLDDLFDRVRLRVSEKTNGIEVPWYASKVTQPFSFVERTADAPRPQVAASAELRSQPLREFRGDQEAYVAALQRDTLADYEEFSAAFPDSPLIGRVRALIAVRREAITWRRTLSINTQDAYWSYRQRYPRGAHAADAERRLARLAAAYDPPSGFVPMAFADVEPPPPDEVVYLSQQVVVFDGPGFVLPPPVPVFFCPPPPPEFVVLAPPPPPIGAFFLPVPSVPLISGPRPWVRPPAFVQAPPPAPIQRLTINNTTVINQRSRGGATQVSAALPSAVVTRVNSGALKAPPPAPPPPAPIQTAALPGATTLGKPTTFTPPRTGSTTATSIPSEPPPGPISPGNMRPTTGPNTATTTPGGPPMRPISPTTRRTTGPNTATATPGGPPGSGPQPSTGGRPLQGPPTTTTPSPSRPDLGATPPPSPVRPATPPPHTPQVVNRQPPAAERIAPPPPAPRVTSPPSPSVTRAGPPPPAAPVIPPPPTTRIAPPPPAARVAPPPPVEHAAPPPQATARPAPPPPAAKKCVIQDGKQVCS